MIILIEWRLMNELYQEIKTRFELGPVSHMVHIDNFESIVQAGGLYSKNEMILKAINYKDIADSSVQSGRSEVYIKETGKPLHDYVPLYWGNKTPMVSAVREHNESLLFLRFSTNLLSEYDCVISDRNARSNDTIFREYSSIEDLEILNPKLINSHKYAKNGKESLAYKQKQAELLVLKFLPLKYMHSVICFDSMIQNKVSGILAKSPFSPYILVNRGFYYV